MSSRAISKASTRRSICFDRQQDNCSTRPRSENGAFRIEGVAEAPASAILTDARDMRGTFGVMLILEPGTITVARSEQEQNALFATGTVSNDANDGLHDRRQRR